MELLFINSREGEGGWHMFGTCLTRRRQIICYIYLKTDLLTLTFQQQAEHKGPIDTV